MCVHRCSFAPKLLPNLLGLALSDVYPLPGSTTSSSDYASPQFCRVPPEGGLWCSY